MYYLCIIRFLLFWFEYELIEWRHLTPFCKKKNTPSGVFFFCLKFKIVRGFYFFTAVTIRANVSGFSCAISESILRLSVLPYALSAPINAL